MRHMSLIILIGEDGNKIGNVTLQEAERIAKTAGKDLTMKAKGVYRIADEGKLKYERNKKQKQQRAQRRTHKIKEVKISPNIEEHDLLVKKKHVKEFLDKGLKTKVTMFFRRRQIAFKSSGLKKMKEFIKSIVDEELCTMDREPKFEGRNLITFLTPRKEEK